MNRPNFRAPLLAVFAVLVCGCVRETGSSVPISRATTPYAIAVLDSAQITSRDGNRSEVQVAQDGRIDLPAGTKYVRGLPVRDFHSLISRAYPGARQIEIREFRTNRVTVLGEVFHQIHTDLSDGPMRVMDAIAAANGFTPLANKRRVRLVRQNAGAIEVYELDLRDLMRGSRLDQNLLLEPGDVITVPRNFL
jgi:protein involved in polysaccharide export with SLBB domain